MLDTQEIINTIALTRINYFHLTGMLQLYRRLGSATAVIEHRRNIRDVLPDASPKLVQSLQQLDEPLHRAEIELQWDLENGVMPLCMNDENYPQRLRQCDDAPLMLFYKGNINLNQRRVICVVGTRRNTVYGEDLIRRFMRELRQLCPQLLVISGLAYGVDIIAHRQALQNGYPTVGVLAHGVDYLYPARHKQTADEMVKKGGLLTEFLTQTNADKVNFVRRNRIVAGISDACVVVESAAHGGGLITASLARTYNREVFAFPGNIGSQYSEGCNNLIRDNVAGLISNADDFVKSMNWDDDVKLQRAQQVGIERQLFPDLSAEERQVVSALKKHNDLQINMLSVQADIPIAHLTAILFSLEMKGVLKALPGGMYHLLMM
ncbi:DNA-processing protein DprA [Hoylesella timonensis]|uniref:DNA protecting protein DprA n=1 Tax=Hoylesella timonensis CRIS 5C-B1 TaxID=679189 RepID=D1VYZ9_9BACT|nr:DNA-processing protein DprA [Hoylesella timonensis]EFA97678.1 DNA protecting protein DprA [Hoylesella timonensis CRIS 5C-B1]